MPRITRLTPEEDDEITRAAESDPDTRPLTDEQLAEMRPIPEEEKARFRRARGPQRAPTKVVVSIRLDPDLLERLKEGGSGWQSRANDMLRRATGLD